MAHQALGMCPASCVPLVFVWAEMCVCVLCVFALIRHGRLSTWNVPCILCAVTICLGGNACVLCEFALIRHGASSTWNVPCISCAVTICLGGYVCVLCAFALVRHGTSSTWNVPCILCAVIWVKQEHGSNKSVRSNVFYTEARKRKEEVPCWKTILLYNMLMTNGNTAVINLARIFIQATSLWNYLAT